LKLSKPIIVKTKFTPEGIKSGYRENNIIEAEINNFSTPFKFRTYMHSIYGNTKNVP